MRGVYSADSRAGGVAPIGKQSALAIQERRMDCSWIGCGDRRLQLGLTQCDWCYPAVTGHARYTTMTLDVAEFIRRFLIHVLPKGFHRIRHYGFLASATKAANLATARERLNASAPDATTGDTAAADADTPTRHCPSCGGHEVTIADLQAAGAAANDLTEIATALGQLPKS